MSLMPARINAVPPFASTRPIAPSGAIAKADTEPAPLPVKPMRPSLVTTRSEEHTSELQSRLHLVCRLLLEKKKKQKTGYHVFIETSRSTIQHNSVQQTVQCT